MKKYNVCIVGGGSTYTLGFLKSFARMQEEFPLNKLVLFDIDGRKTKTNRTIWRDHCLKKDIQNWISHIQQILLKLIKTWTSSLCRCVQVDSHASKR